MGKHILAGVFLWLSAGSLAWAEDEAALRKQLTLFNQAFMQADITLLGPMLHDDYQHTNSGNKAFGKTAWLAWVNSRREKVHQSELVYSRYDTEDLKLVMGNGMAVVTGRNIAAGVDAGAAFTVDIRFTHVWVWQDERWQRLAFHDAPAH